MLASVAKLVGKSLAEIKRRHRAPVVRVYGRRVFISGSPLLLPPDPIGMTLQADPRYAPFNPRTFPEKEPRFRLLPVAQV